VLGAGGLYWADETATAAPKGRAVLAARINTRRRRERPTAKFRSGFGSGQCRERYPSRAFPVKRYPVPR